MKPIRASQSSHDLAAARKAGLVDSSGAPAAVLSQAAVGRAYAEGPLQPALLLDLIVTFTETFSDSALLVDLTLRA